MFSQSSISFLAKLSLTGSAGKLSLVKKAPAHSSSS